MNFRNRSKIILVFIGIGIVLPSFFLSIFGLNPPKSAIDEFFYKKNEALGKQKHVDYRSVVQNGELLRYLKMRDDFNMNWYQLTKQHYNNFGGGVSYRSGYRFFNWAVISCVVSSDIPDYETIELNGSRFYGKGKLNHIILLHKLGDKWYLEKDVFHTDQQPSFSSLLGQTYSNLQLQKLIDARKNINTYAKEFSKLDMRSYSE